MNLIKKQGFLNSIFLYLGTALAFVNLMIIFQRSLSIREIGFYNILTSVVLLYVQFASWGISNVITRYLPIFRTVDKKHQGFATYAFGICGLTFGLFTVAFFLLKDQVIAYKAADTTASLMDQYYGYFFPIALCATIYLLQESFARTVFKTLLPSFLREVVLRLFASCGAIFILLKWIDYRGFIDLYLIGNILVVLVISIYVHRIGAYRFGAIQDPVKREFRPMLQFGFYSMLGGSSFTLLQNLDVLILKLLSGEEMVGIYATFFGIAQVIALPARAFNITSYQIIANAWKEQELGKIQKIYQKTTMVQGLVGALLLVTLIVNRDNLLTLLHKPEYPQYFNVMILVGLAFLVDATGGINQAIIGFSKHYRWVMILMAAAAILCGLFNFLLIPLFGLEGAALSYLLTMIVTNFSFWLFLLIKFRMQPFTFKNTYILVISAVSLAIGWAIPPAFHFILDAVIRSAIVLLVFGALTYLFRVSPDINEELDKYILRKK